MKLTHAAVLLSLLTGVIRCAPSSDKAAASAKSQIEAILRLRYFEFPDGQRIHFQKLR